jgi:Uma2 family endonuclease
MVQALAEHHVFLTYDQGTLEIMSPSPRHEMLGLLIARMIHSYTQIHRIPIFSLGMTTWKRRDLERGLEADQCFYVQHEPGMRLKTQIDLTFDPPPDLAIEVDLSNSSTRKQKIYAALAVPELWRLEEERLFPTVLKDGTYVEAESSLAFPNLPVRELMRFINMRDSTGETEVAWAFKEWVEQGL